MDNRSASKNSNLKMKDFRSLLQETLVNRCKTNPAYSLRAFAKQLGLEPSFLSKLISGKRSSTPNVIKKVTTILGLDPVEVEAYLASAEKMKGQKDTKLAYKDLAIDHFAMIADWYHYAILEITHVEGFKSDADWISQKLGINKIQAQDALERLERLEMLTKDEKGQYRNTSGSNTTISSEFTAAAFKKLQKQILLQALDALENIPFEARDQSSITMAINPELLPEAKNRIKKFRRELCAFLEDSGRPRKQVYQLSTSLFPITYID